jgi:hypothetical protein
MRSRSGTVATPPSAFAMQQQRQRRRPAARSSTGRHAVDERHAHDYQLKANLFVTMQVEIGTARRMVRVSRDALTSELLWALLQCGDNCLAWEHELPSGRFARFAIGADALCHGSA